MAISYNYCTANGTAYGGGAGSLGGLRGPRGLETMPEKAVMGPEFVYRSRLPAVRLKAQLRKRHGLMSGRPEAAVVWVELLSGQRLEVGCRSDSTAGDVFEAVVQHQDLHEHSLHGLSVLQDGEHFFLEPERKLLKTAPPGWGRARKHSLAARNVYTLFLRLRHYPLRLDFVKTPRTLHEVYLQLRRDFAQEERLQTDKEQAFQLAALMLQAEYGDRGAGDEAAPSNAYFQLDHYLPQRHMLTEVGGDERVRSVLAEIHRSHYAGLSSADAELEFLHLCQKQPEYGLHFYRLYRSKQASNLTPSPLGDPDTGTLLWVGISAQGLGIFEDRHGERGLQDPKHWHEWLSTQSIKFDRKRFVIVPVGSTESQTYYTDSNKKSTYFVRFAMAQHRFNMRMRNWSATVERRTRSREGSRGPHAHSTLHTTTNGARDPHSLSNKSTDSGVRELGESREASPDEKIAAAAAASAASSQPSAPPRRQANGSSVLEDSIRSTPSAVVDEPSRDRSRLNGTGVSVSDSLTQRLEEAEDSAAPASYKEFPVSLRKDPQCGLGLTLVDGNLQGVRGVFVKSLTPDGPAQAQGRLRVGDMIKSINDISLDGKDRHDAVALVKSASDGRVRMDILRIGELGEEEEEAGPAAPAAPVYRSQDIKASMVAELEKEEAAALRVPATIHSRTNSSHGTSASTRSSRSSGEFRLHGEAEQDPKAPLPKSSTTLPSRYTGLHDSDSDESTLAQSHDRRHAKKSQDSDQEPDYGAGRSATLPPAFDSSLVASHNDDDRTPTHGNSSESMGVGGGRNRSVSGTDWVDGISFEERPSDEEEGDVEAFSVTMPKEGGSLGLKIAGGSKGQSRIYVKALVGNPALSCDNLRPGDRLVSVNGASTERATHGEAVELLRQASSPVTLGLTRPLPTSPGPKPEETVLVELEKPSTGSLGMSLARPTGGEGIYVRVITPGSPADVDGRLRVGDRLWKINDESVADASPLDVVQMLKAAQGLVRLTLKRS